MAATATTDRDVVHGVIEDAGAAPDAAATGDSGGSGGADGRGHLSGHAGGAGGEMIVLAIPGTDYRIHLVAPTPGIAAGGSGPRRVSGRIIGRLQRAGAARAGGRFLEPVYGRPRRVQGLVVAADPAANTLTLSCGAGCALVGELTGGQRAERFPLGTLVNADVERGARFAPTTA